MLLSYIHRRLIRLPRRVKKRIHAGVDFALLGFAIWLALSLAHNRPFVPPDWSAAVALTSVAVLGTCLLRLGGLHDAVVRYLSAQFLRPCLKAATSVAALLFLLGFVLNVVTVPFSALLHFWLLCFCLLGGSRVLMRQLLQPRAPAGARPAENVVIYGAGAAGAELASALGQDTRHIPVAFVDDDPGLHGSRIRGLRIHSPAALETLVREHEVRQVLLAMPSASRARRRALLAPLENLAVRIRTIPPLRTIVAGQAPLDELRDIDIEDLLGRETVPPDPALLDACIKGKAVMVTGAGGSIGSELCRQILSRSPARLVLFDVSEYSLYRIDTELREQLAGGELEPVEIVPILGSVVDAERIASAIANHRVQTIYHAAAYKHVPLVESNMIEGVRNNVFGTWHAARAAAAEGVEHFVLVSTDKAIRPTNVMGASKRVAELILQALQQELNRAAKARPASREAAPGTVFSIVRFGNVLDSSGSVVPRFREQIRRGQTVTVTHPEITRFFMTIPEAAELVLQAGALARGGDVFLLDMGEPVRIIDLARRMVRLMGRQVRDEHGEQGDVEIAFTGLRPGEKLHEELLIDDTAQPTRHSMILRAVEFAPPWAQVRALLGSLQEAIAEHDCPRTRQLLSEVVHGYRPHESACDSAHDGTLRRGAQAIEVNSPGNAARVTPIRDTSISATRPTAS